MAAPRHIMIGKVNWWWYLVPIMPILLVGYGALVSVLPAWALLIAVFAFSCGCSRWSSPCSPR